LSRQWGRQAVFAAVCFLLPCAEAQASVSLYFSSSHFSVSSSIFGRWWCCRGWLGGMVEAMVVAMRTAAGGSSSPLLSSVSLLVSAFFLFFHSPYTLKIPRFVRLFHTKNSPLFLSFSLPKNPPWICRLLLSFSKILPPLFSVLPPCIYRQPGERFTIPCPSAGHGGVGWLLCSRCRAWPSSSFVVVAGHAGMGGVSEWSSRVERESGKKHFKNLLLPCLCILQGRRSSTVLFWTAPWFFFLRK